MNIDNFPLWTALVTPFDQQLAVDWTSLKNLIIEQKNAGNGLLILGSTAEALNLTAEMKKEIVQFAIKNKGDSPLMIGVGGHQIDETTQWVQYLESTKSIDSYLMVTPIYAKPGTYGQLHWFSTLMDQVSKPVMLYNVPGRSAVQLSVETVSLLSTHKNFWAIKEASGSVEKFKEYVKAANGKKVFCGDDALMPDFCQHGCAGLVSVASNVWPLATHLYVKQCLNKTFDAKELWEKASNSLFMVSNPVPAKRILFELKRISTPMMMPPLSNLDLKDPTILKEFTIKIQQWFKDQKAGL